MEREIDDSTRIVESEVGASMIREYVTVHDSTVGDDCGIYERTSVKKCHVGDSVEINAGCYVENAEIGDEVQIGPNCSVVGVTHNLGEDGMELRNDVFERIILHEGAFVGAGAVVAPGVEIGPNAVVAAGSVVTTDVDERCIVVGSPPTQTVSHLREWL
jgi:acetyltransferase-like isoleucine patch superfamily enzyme